MIHSYYYTGVLFALATLEIHGDEVQAREIVSAVGGLKELKKGICAEQDKNTFKWLKEFCK
jgi:hypothetical protein